MSGTQHLLKALVARWAASGLDTTFKHDWTDPTANYPTLSDTQAPPNQPWPYAVFEQGTTTVAARMSDDSTQKRQLLTVPITFRVHAKQKSGDSRTPKQIAAVLVAAIMDKFGGNTNQQNVKAMPLDEGTHVQTQYVNDLGMYQAEEEYVWIIEYEMLLDMPVAAS